MSSSTSDVGANALPLGKYLASTDKKTRDKAVKSLAAFLSSARQPLPKLEMAKLWKGIFYCYWMSDKPLVQQALASELAELLLTIPSTDNSLAFLSGFWEAIVREWNGIDRLRMDKYYMLVRKFINASLRLMGRDEWNREAILAYNEILARKGGPLCPEDSRGTTRPTVSFFDPLFNALRPPMQEGPLTKRPRLDSDEGLEALKGNSCLENPEEGKIENGKLRQQLCQKMFDIASGSDLKKPLDETKKLLTRNNYYNYYFCITCV
ncbi:ribosomal rna processing [Pyrrhoderma noxium]|uniref:Ribosomal rna processing n=1 Tax=Pyrrhoderma noxium TaxID=2282107 RepID=A0A286UR61_9AGAM|nr:ribosomal rna processing [Pyrrhoderma noxium]